MCVFPPSRRTTLGTSSSERHDMIILITQTNSHQNSQFSMCHGRYVIDDIHKVGYGYHLTVKVRYGYHLSVKGYGYHLTVKMETLHELWISETLFIRNCYQLSIKSLLISYQEGVFGYQTTDVCVLLPLKIDLVGHKRQTYCVSLGRDLKKHNTSASYPPTVWYGLSGPLIHQLLIENL